MMKNIHGSVKFYHATNLICACKMLKSGMGLDTEYYTKLGCRIASITGVDETHLLRLLQQRGRLSPGATHGGVSGFSSYASAARIVCIYAKSGGEWHGSFIQSAFKTAARLKKVKLSTFAGDMHDVLETYAGIFSEPVVVVAKVPVAMLVIDPQHPDYEIYTKNQQHIPSKFIQTILTVAPIELQ